MSYTIVRPKDRDEWLEERKKGIGSSDAGTIMGSSPFNTPYNLWLQKMGKAEPFKESDAMFNGHVLEPAIAEWFALKTGNIVDRNSEGDWLAVDDDKPYLRVSPDRIYWTPETPESQRSYANGRILEIKSTSKTVDKDNLPDYWFCQVQYQMGVMGIENACIAWLTSSPKLQFDYAEVKFNQAFFNTLISRIDTFWNINLQRKIAPAPVNGSDADRMYEFADEKSKMEAGEDIRTLCFELRDIKKRKKEIEEREEEITDMLKIAFGKSETMQYTDTETGKTIMLATWKNTSVEKFDELSFRTGNPEIWDEYKVEHSPTLDSARLKKEKPDIYKKYTVKVTGARRFSLKT